MNAADRLEQREREVVARQKATQVRESQELVEVMKPAGNVFLVELAALLRKETEAEWDKGYTKNTNRWYTFKTITELVEGNLEKPSFEVLGDVQKQCRKLIKLFGKNDGYGKASVDILNIVKKHAGN